MVLFFSSNALGDDKPAVIYAGKDKVRLASPHAAQRGRELTSFLPFRSSRVRSPPLASLQSLSAG